MSVRTDLPCRALVASSRMDVFELVVFLCSPRVESCMYLAGGDWGCRSRTGAQRGTYDGGGGDDEWKKSSEVDEGRLCVGPFFWRFSSSLCPELTS